MKKVLVTGATGFIGTYVINELLLLEYEVIATSSNIINAEKKEWFKKVVFIPLDFKMLEDVNYYEFFERPDIVIHLAWEGLPNYKSLFHIEENLPLHYKLIKNLVINGIPDITITGTCFEYGMQEGSLHEQLPSLPGNPYGLAKDSLRKFLDELKKHYPFHLKWVRLFYMFGKGQNPNSLLSQLEKALMNREKVFNMSGGDQQRDYLPVELVADYLVKIATQNAITGIINCCSGRPISVKQFVMDYLHDNMKAIKLNLGYYPYTDYESMHFWGDDTKLKSITGEG